MASEANSVEHQRAIESFNKLDFEPTARQIYDQFLLTKPDIAVQGLFRAGSQYYIVAPKIDSAVADGRTLKQWFDESFAPAAMPFHLVVERPAGSIELQPRAPTECAEGYGLVRTWPDLQRDLALWLPSSIPYVDVQNDDRTAVIQVERTLTPEEHAAVETVFERMGSAVPMRVEVAPDGPLPRSWNVDNLHLKPARLLRSTLPKSVRESIAEDDDFWRTNGPAHLTATPDKTVLPWAAVPSEQSCLVDTVFPPQNLRSYLSLYSSVCLVAPVGDAEGMRQGLGISQKELLELAQRGILRFLLPQSVERYDANWLAELIEAAPQSVLHSRRLAAASLVDQRRRNPLFWLAASAYEKRSILRSLLRAADSAPEVLGKVLRALAHGLSEHWGLAEHAIHLRGSMASLSGGLSNFGASFAMEFYKRDLWFELSVAAQNVEWAGALGAHLVPEQVDGYSSEGASALLVALSSGTVGTAEIAAAPRQFELAQDLLAFDHDMNVLVFVDEVSAGDLSRFRARAREVIRSGKSVEEISEVVELWNAQVRRYEKRPDRLKSFNIVATLMAAAGLASPAAHAVVPFAMLLLPALLTAMNEEVVPESASIGTLSDWANGTLAGVVPDAVLVSRLRKNVKALPKGRP